MRKMLLSACSMLVLLAYAAEVSGQTRIRFARGRTSTTVSGSWAVERENLMFWVPVGARFSRAISARGETASFFRAERRA